MTKLFTAIFNGATRQTLWPVLALLLSASLLGGAYAFQYIGGLTPCQMCYWQRHAHKAVLGFSVLAIVAPFINLSSRLRRMLLALIAAAFVLSFGLAFWHVGVEFKWWEGPKTCAVSAMPSSGFNASTILEDLNKPMKTPACSDVAWALLGVSMAGWNALFSFFAAMISGYVFLKGSSDA